jgi:hypothetical protein
LARNTFYQAHKSQASHNYDFVQSLSPTKSLFPDWVIVGLFYMALHFVNAHAAKVGWRWKKYHPRDPSKVSAHTQRLRYVRSQFGNRVFRDYMHLYQECWNARYDPFYLNRAASSMAVRLIQKAMQFRRIA